MRRTSHGHSELLVRREADLRQCDDAILVGLAFTALTRLRNEEDGNIRNRTLASVPVILGLVIEPELQVVLALTNSNRELDSG